MPFMAGPFISTDMKCDVWLEDGGLRALVYTKQKNGGSALRDGDGLLPMSVSTSISMAALYILSDCAH